MVHSLSHNAPCWQNQTNKVKQTCKIKTPKTNKQIYNQTKTQYTPQQTNYNPGGGVKYDIVHMRDQAFSKQPLKRVWFFTKKRPLNKF